MIAIVRLYCRLYWLVKQLFDVNLKGLGFSLSLLRREFFLEIDGRKILFHPKAARSYGLLLIGKYNELETHLFLRHVLGSLSGTERLCFVDVGASVGEFVNEAATSPCVTRIIAIEASQEAADVIRRSVQANGDEHRVSVIQKVCGTSGGTETFAYNPRSPMSSRVGAEAPGSEARIMAATTLDAELSDISAPTIILVDVEGSEPAVLEGGRAFIGSNLPLIIFEYNETSRKYFTLDDMRTILGEEWLFFRLRPDGRLDKDLSRTWNVVAVHHQSQFYDACVKAE